MLKNTKRHRKVDGHPMYRPYDFSIENTPSYDVKLIPIYQNLLRYSEVYQRSLPKDLFEFYCNDRNWAYNDIITHYLEVAKEIEENTEVKDGETICPKIDNKTLKVFTVTGE